MGGLHACVSEVIFGLGKQMINEKSKFISRFWGSSLDSEKGTTLQQLEELH